MKRVMVINDICCFGRCSLTYNLPIISAAGIECSVLPTVILSAHTGFPGFTFFDMQSQFKPIADSLLNLSAKFDGIMASFLATKEQIAFAGEFIDNFGGGLIVVDPAMADNGKMYNSSHGEDFAKAMACLCQKADVILPNLTEACFLTGEEYKEAPYLRDYVENILHKLLGLGAKSAVVTGISFEDGKIGCAIINSNKEISCAFTEKSAENMSGTGDIFSSVVMAGLMRGFTLEKSCRIAAEYVCLAMQLSQKSNTESSHGINFEQAIPDLLKKLEII